jgi:nitric-oxide synthase
MFGLPLFFRRRPVVSSSGGEKRHGNGEQEEQPEPQMQETDNRSTGHLQERLFSEARNYLHLFHDECGLLSEEPVRQAAVQAEIASTGTYRQTEAELTHGARVAWRNNMRCIGRLHWQTLVVRDFRHLTSAEDIFQALLEHLRFATNGGKIRSTISIFAPASPGQPGIRIWNPQLIRYAGYRQPDGTIVGDPLHVDLTDAVRMLGWQGGAGTPFDRLPVVIQMPGEQPRLFDLPDDVVLEVPLTHPSYPWFAELGLKWHAVPVISNMRLEIGGISYTAAPFNGWYMGTEIGSRDLGDVGRYGVLPVVAKRMGLEMSGERSLWRDRAVVELNIAVVSSFGRQRVSLVDHHTASRQFLLHVEHEECAGREVPGDWTWLVPPLSGSTSPIFHMKTLKKTRQTPNFWMQGMPSGWLQSRE